MLPNQPTPITDISPEPPPTHPMDPQPPCKIPEKWSISSHLRMEMSGRGRWHSTPYMGVNFMGGGSFMCHSQFWGEGCTYKYYYGNKCGPCHTNNFIGYLSTFFLSSSEICPPPLLHTIRIEVYVLYVATGRIITYQKESKMDCIRYQQCVSVLRLDPTIAVL